MAGQINIHGKRLHSDYNDHGRNKRRNSNDDRGLNSIGPNDTVYRYLCPSKRIGRIMGKGGDIVKQMRAKTKAKIRIGEMVNGFDDRVVTVYCNSEETNDFEGMDDRLCPSMDALFKVHDRVVSDDRGDDDEDNMDGVQITVRLLVPADQIGCCIGKGGQIVQDIRSDTGAQIRILKENHLPACALNSDELVQISGEASNVRKALFQVAGRLHDNPSRSQHLLNSSPPNVYPSGAALMGTTPGAPMMGLPPLVNAYGGYKAEGGEWPQSYFPVPREGSSPREFSLRLICPTSNIGGVIGKGGAAINQIRQETGASIKVDSSKTEGDDCLISISANEIFEDTFSPAIEAALRLQPKCSERVERDSGHVLYTTRLLVPASWIGCLIGKGGSIITEIRRISKANVRIISKEDLPKIAVDDDEMVQISAELDLAKDAFLQITSRLRANLFEREGVMSTFVPVLPHIPLEVPDVPKYDHRDSKGHRRGHSYSTELRAYDGYGSYGGVQKKDASSALVPGSADALGLRSGREMPSKKQATASPSNTRNSVRSEKQTSPNPSPVKKKPEKIEKAAGPSPLRRSDRGKKLAEVYGLSDIKSKKEKSANSAKQSAGDVNEVKENGRQDPDVSDRKRKKFTIHRYKALFRPQRIRLEIVEYKNPEGKDKSPQANTSNNEACLDVDKEVKSLEIVDQTVAADSVCQQMNSFTEGHKVSLNSRRVQGIPDKDQKMFLVENSTVLEQVEHVGCPSQTKSNDGKFTESGNVEKQICDNCSPSNKNLADGDNHISHTPSSMVNHHLENHRERDSCDKVTRTCKAAAVMVNAENDDAATNLQNSGNTCISSKFVEFWVPVQISNVQLEQYCATLLSNAMTLHSCSKTDSLGALSDIFVSNQKCCNHPYLVDPHLQKLITKDLEPSMMLDAGIKASGKLRFLDLILPEVKKRQQRVLVLFQPTRGTLNGHAFIGNILEEFVLQRFGQESYERVNGFEPISSKKSAALNKFNKEMSRFIFLLESHACHQSIKLSSVDIIIIFDSDLIPATDLKALQKVNIDSQSEPIMIFRLYSSSTLEEKILKLAEQNVAIDIRSQTLRSNYDALLTLGASELFNKLTEFHTASVCSISADGSLTKDVVEEFLYIVSHKSKSRDSVKSLITRVQNFGIYGKNIPLHSEIRTHLPNGDQPHVFWRNLLEGRNPLWKFVPESTPRQRKRPIYFLDSSDEESGMYGSGVKTRWKTVISTIEPAQWKPVIERGSRGINEGGSGPPVHNESQSSSGDPMAVANEMSLHDLLKPTVSELCSVLKFSEYANKLDEHERLREIHLKDLKARLLAVNEELSLHVSQHETQVASSLCENPIEAQSHDEPDHDTYVSIPNVTEGDDADKIESTRSHTPDKQMADATVSSEPVGEVPAQQNDDMEIDMAVADATVLSEPVAEIPAQQHDDMTGDVAVETDLAEMELPLVDSNQEHASLGSNSPDRSHASEDGDKTAPNDVVPDVDSEEMGMPGGNCDKENAEDRTISPDTLDAAEGNNEVSHNDVGSHVDSAEASTPADNYNEDNIGDNDTRPDTSSHAFEDHNDLCGSNNNISLSADVSLDKTPLVQPSATPPSDHTMHTILEIENVSLQVQQPLDTGVQDKDGQVDLSSLAETTTGQLGQITREDSLLDPHNEPILPSFTEPLVPENQSNILPLSGLLVEHSTEPTLIVSQSGESLEEHLVAAETPLGEYESSLPSSDAPPLPPPINPLDMFDNLYQVVARMPNHSDPLQAEVERLCTVNHNVTKFHEDIKQTLNSDCDKKITEVIAQIRLKYEAKHQEADAAFHAKKKELDTNLNRVLMNRILAEAFRAKCQDLTPSVRSGMQQVSQAGLMQQLHRVSGPSSMRRSPGTASTSPGQAHGSQQTTPPPPSSPRSLPPQPPLQIVHQPAALFSSTPSRPQHSTNLQPPSTISIRPPPNTNPPILNSMSTRPLSNMDPTSPSTAPTRPPPIVNTVTPSTTPTTSRPPPVINTITPSTTLTTIRLPPGINPITPSSTPSTSQLPPVSRPITPSSTSNRPSPGVNPINFSSTQNRSPYITNPADMSAANLRINTETCGQTSHVRPVANGEARTPPPRMQSVPSTEIRSWAPHMRSAISSESRAPAPHVRSMASSGIRAPAPHMRSMVRSEIRAPAPHIRPFRSTSDFATQWGMPQGQHVTSSLPLASTSYSQSPLPTSSQQLLPPLPPEASFVPQPPPPSSLPSTSSPHPHSSSHIPLQRIPSVTTSGGPSLVSTDNLNVVMDNGARFIIPPDLSQFNCMDIYNLSHSSANELVCLSDDE